MTDLYELAWEIIRLVRRFTASGLNDDKLAKLIVERIESAGKP